MSVRVYIHLSLGIIYKHTLILIKINNALGTIYFEQSGALH